MCDSDSPTDITNNNNIDPSHDSDDDMILYSLPDEKSSTNSQLTITNNVIKSIVSPHNNNNILNKPTKTIKRTTIKKKSKISNNVINLFKRMDLLTDNINFLVNKLNNVEYNIETITASINLPNNMKNTPNNDDNNSLQHQDGNKCIKLTEIGHDSLSRVTSIQPKIDNNMDNTNTSTTNVTSPSIEQFNNIVTFCKSPTKQSTNYNEHISDDDTSNIDTSCIDDLLFNELDNNPHYSSSELIDANSSDNATTSSIKAPTINPFILLDKDTSVIPSTYPIVNNTYDMTSTNSQPNDATITNKRCKVFHRHSHKLRSKSSNPSTNSNNPSSDKSNDIPICNINNNNNNPIISQLNTKSKN